MATTGRVRAPWSSRDNRLLREMYEQGKRDGEIGVALDRTPRAVQQHRFVRGLKSSPGGWRGGPRIRVSPPGGWDEWMEGIDEAAGPPRAEHPDDTLAPFAQIGVKMTAVGGPHGRGRLALNTPAALRGYREGYPRRIDGTDDVRMIKTVPGGHYA